MAPARRVWAWTGSIFLITLVWNASLGLATRPTGPREDHFGLGQRLHATGTLVEGDDLGVLKPPGFPVFVAVTLHVRDVVARVVGVDSELRQGAWTDRRAVQLAHCLAWALAAAAIFAVLLGFVSPFEAACLALAFGCAPLGLALVGALTYPALHTVGTALGTVALVWALRQPPNRRTPPLLAGAIWGLATLVRPVSLLLPPLVLVLARLRKASTWRAAVLSTVLFCGGLGAVILPYAVRNSLRAGRPTLVNTQGGFALWAPTEWRLRDDQRWLVWSRLWRKRGLGVYGRVTGLSEHSYAAMRAHAAELNSAFMRQALLNIRDRPGVYLHNVRRQLVQFTLDRFEYWPYRYLRRNDTPKPARRLVMRWVRALSVGLMLLALPGVILGLWRRDLAVWTVLAVFAMLVAAHAATLVQPSYTYPKLPLLILAVGLTLHHLGHRRPKAFPRWPLGVRVSSALALAVALVSLATSAALFLVANP